MIGYSGRASILDIILRDATKYFVIIFSAHLLSTLFLFVAPVGGSSSVRRSSPAPCLQRSCLQENLQLMPGMWVLFYLDATRTSSN